ncbi:MAG: hypothetical protein NTV80_13245 [Verrucomicrobia bacterium]|nr:hypothetical protein [Verrucomicrobiota bacterium]
MQTEIISVPSRDWQWFTKSLVLGGLFTFILLFELTGMSIFGWLGVRGLLGLQSQPWIATGSAFIGALGFGFVITRQLPFMVGEIAGYYTLQIALDCAVLRLRLPVSLVVRRIRLTNPTYVDVLPLIPGMTLIMLQSKDKLSFGSTLSHGEQLRLHSLIRAALMLVSGPNMNNHQELKPNDSEPST